jgi:hypothetical protein
MFIFHDLMFLLSGILHLNGYNAKAMGLDFADKTMLYAMYY